MINQYLVPVFIWISILLMHGNLSAQNFSVRFRPVFSDENLVVDKSVFDKNGDSLVVQTLKFYIGQVGFLRAGQVVFQDKNYHLIDLENDKTLTVDFQIPENLDFDSLQFDFGVDSFTTVSGVMGGDLDPTRGMFWTWQSGYIHAKIEGYSSRYLSQKRSFAFHLGGFAAPFSAIQQVLVPAPVNEKMTVFFDLAPFFDQVDWVKKSNVMSPGKESVRLAQVIAKSFFSHEK